MSFLPKVTTLAEPGPSYTIHVASDWIVVSGSWAGLHGDLTINLDYRDSSTGDPSHVEDPEGELANEQADARVQDLVNRISTALEGSDWSIDSSRTRKNIAAYQPIEADEE